MDNSLKIHIDGACQPNPGSGGIGIHIVSEENEEKISLPIKGLVTNNIAEYEALIVTLQILVERKIQYKKIEINSDSQLICMQFNKKWKCKDKKLQILLDKALTLCEKIQSEITLNYIPRENNTIADQLAKDGIS